MNINEALAYIHSVTWRGSIPGLSRTRELLSRMGNPEHKLRFIHVAGTNGKGSTCAMLASILQQAGYRTGLYTSPYITCFHERMQVNGHNISDEMLCEITEFVRPHAQAMEDLPTEFELVTAIAFEYFKRMKCDIVVLECGMGGEFDSTNVIPVPEAAVLCRIGLDHMQQLGATLPEIAQTKAGIFKDGGLCITYPACEEVETVYCCAAKARNLRWVKADFGRLHPVSHSLKGQEFVFDGFGALRLSLLGRNQLDNVCLVLTVVEELRAKGWSIPDSAVKEGLKQVSWPGRFELIHSDPIVIVDGGHNTQCLESLRENIDEYIPVRDLVAIVGVMADKEYEKMFLPLLPRIRRFVTVAPPNPRALGAEALADYLCALGADAVPAASVAEAAALGKSFLHTDSVLLAFGSLYMLGELRSCFLHTEIGTKGNLSC